MLTKDDTVRERLLRALTGHPNGYRAAISPAEMIDRHAPVPSHQATPSLAQRLRQLLRPDRTHYPKH
jgi:hypothetical protein